MNIRLRTGAALTAAATVGSLCACSMATSIQRDALDYNAGVANYNDQMLIYTILRARDEAPINLLALSTINGSISVQAGLSAGSTYQMLDAAASSHQITAAITPTAQATASPTWSMASLNTQGFTLGIMQPISPMYIVSKWSTGLNREFLLRLFIKSIHLTEAGGYHEYLNDPNSPAAMSEFGAKLHSWFPRISMRVLTVLEPLGPPLDPSTVTSVSTNWDPNRGSRLPDRIERTEVGNPASASLLGAYQYLMPLGGGPFYVGNAAPAAANGPPRLQLYREYPQQVVVCVSRPTLGTEPLTSSAAPLGDEQEEEQAISAYALALKSAAKGGAGNGSGSSGSPAASGGSETGQNHGSGSIPSPSSSLSSNLKVDRVAAVLPLGACGQSELVLPAYTEEENAKFSGTYSHVEWRSIEEVINYLGALLRARNASAGRWTDTDATGTTLSHLMFELSSDSKPGFTQVKYRDQHYTIRTDAERDAGAPQNHSLQALALLNELISAAKVSSDIPNTQEIQFVP
jgi:hypothetical protein